MFVPAATVTLTVIAVNDQPVVSDAAYTMAACATLTGNVLADAHDADGDALTVTNVSPLSTSFYAAIFSLTADGAFSFQEGSGLSHTVSFSYDVSDGHGSSTTAQTTITVLVPRVQGWGC